MNFYLYLANCLVLVMNQYDQSSKLFFEWALFNYLHAFLLFFVQFYIVLHYRMSKIFNSLNILIIIFLFIIIIFYLLKILIFFNYYIMFHIQKNLKSFKIFLKSISKDLQCLFPLKCCHL